MNLEKNKTISNSLRLTKEKRSSQICKVFELKIKKHRLNKQQLEYLEMIFVESKWIYNYLIGKMLNDSFDIFKYNSKNLKTITHKDKDLNDIEVNLKYTGSSIRQALVSRIQSQIKILSSLKKSGHKVGKLKFKSQYNCIYLKQNNTTHKILSKNKIKIQGISKPLFVSGLDQMSKYSNNYDIANAILKKIDDDYYIYLTVFYDKQDIKNQIFVNDIIGIDFGCQTTLTLSNGKKINVIVEETEKLKLLKRKRSKTTKFSNNYNRLTKQIHKEYRRLSNIKNNKTNKIVSDLLKTNKLIIIQDEQLHSWHTTHGKKIQTSILGRVKVKLKQHPNQVKVINRFVPTSKLCNHCGHVYKNLKLYDRVYICPECGCVDDRDVHAAQNMVWLFEHLKETIGLDGSKFTRAEFYNNIENIDFQYNIRTSKHEDSSL